MKSLRVAVIGCVAALGLTGAWVLRAQKTYPSAEQMRAHMNDGKCADCHESIWKEWEKSGHAQAWKSKLYQKMRKKYEKEAPKSCDPCHAPQPILMTGVGKMPLLREEGKETGVDCLSCHLDADGAMKGPYNDPSPFHQTKPSNVLYTRQIKICASCHGQPKVLAHNQIAEREKSNKETCQRCHMPETERKPSRYSAKKKRSGAHTFPGSRDKKFLQSVFHLDYDLSSEGLTAFISNAADHAVPASPLREIELRIAVISSGGGVLYDKREIHRHPLDEAGKRVLPKGGDIRLKGSETRAVRIPLSAADLKGASLIVSARYRRSPEDKWVPMSELNAPLGK